MADPVQDTFRQLDNATLAPPRDADRQGLLDRCAVYDETGAEEVLAHTVGRIGPFTQAPRNSPKKPTRTLPGSWLFGGIAYGHFGHALAFSTARLWALDHLDTAPNGILFFARSERSKNDPVTGHLSKLLTLLDVDLPAISLSQPTTVERLIVPSQGWGTGPLITGSPAFRTFTRNRLATGRRPEGAKRLYISRAKLPEKHARGLLFQGMMNRYLTNEGYRIFHPEQHSLPEQITAYRAADHIIAEDGSALHVAAMAADPSTRFAVLGTRPHFPIALATQIQAFTGAKAQVFSFVRAAVAPQSTIAGGMEWNRARILLDYEKLGLALAQTEFVKRPDLWKNPPDPKLDRRIASLASRLKEPIAKLPLAELKKPGTPND